MCKRCKALSLPVLIGRLACLFFALKEKPSEAQIKVEFVVRPTEIKTSVFRLQWCRAPSGGPTPDKFPAAIAEGSHPFPSRTRKLSPPAPMVLHGKPCGRVG